MRYTKKTKLFNGYTRDFAISYVIDKMTYKLGQLEDIEDELGIDLITLFKILEAEECYFEEDGQCFIVGVNKNGVILMPKKFPYGECEHTVPFKELGKTWALTKEGLL